MTAREFADYCGVSDCEETTKRGPTPQQQQQAELAKQTHQAAQRGYSPPTKGRQVA
jgi:hypothetical protein